LVIVLLTGSAVLRLGSGTGQAIAREIAPPKVKSEELSQALPPSTADLGAMLTAFQRREAEIEIREQKIQDRMQALALAERTIDQKLSALIEAEENLRATLTLADGASENDLARLTSVYENMKSKDAAALFEEMAPGFAAGFLGRMRPEAAAGIMAGLSPQVAYTVSVVLAGRNANVPKQ
jgi:flagellar motility protein MotE (MotC chaperone)